MYCERLLKLVLFPAGDRPSERVGVELLLVKQAHKRRKESTGAVERTALGTSEVPVNPSEEHPPSKAPALSIPSESFSLSEGHQTKSYTLVVRVHHSPMAQAAAAAAAASGAANGSNGAQNGEENLEPAAKRRKVLRGSVDEAKVSIEQFLFISCFNKERHFLLGTAYSTAYQHECLIYGSLKQLQTCFLATQNSSPTIILSSPSMNS